LYRWTEKLPAAETPSVVVQEPIANYSMKEEEVESENYEWKELDSRWDKFFIKKNHVLNISIFLVNLLFIRVAINIIQSIYTIT